MDTSARRSKSDEELPRGAAPSALENQPTAFWPSRALISKVALELFIVFVGVSAAFAVDDYREARAEKERRHAVYLALDRELTQMAETTGRAFREK